MEIAQKLYETRPEPFSTEKRDYAKEIFKVAKKGDGLLHCYSIVFLQERDRYNKLISVIDKTLDLLIKAGARLDLKDNWDTTALALAKEENHSKCVALLEAANAP